MAISTDLVIDAIPEAFRRMKQTLFEPFDIGKWFVLGFCAWLANLSESGGPNFRFNLGPPGLGDDFPDVRD